MNAEGVSPYRRERFALVAGSPSIAWTTMFASNNRTICPAPPPSVLITGLAAASGHQNPVNSWDRSPLGWSRPAGDDAMKQAKQRCKILFENIVARPKI